MSEIYCAEGLRNDGRRWNELRQFTCGLNTHPNAADGSSTVHMGATHVICIIKGPREPESRSHSNVERATINVSVKVSPFSTFERKKALRNDKRLAEMERALVETFNEAVMVHLHPRTSIDIQLHVLAQDGGLFAACLNATTLALIDAGIPMTDYVSCVPTALYNSSPLLDPNHLEETELPFLSLAVIGQTEKICTLLSESRLPFDHLEALLAVGIAGCHSIRAQMIRQVRKHGKERVVKASMKS